MSSKHTTVVLAFIASLTLGGCSGMQLDEVSSETPTFDFRTYFLGHNRASGWFSDRFGKPRRHFCGDFIGTQDGDEFVLDETLFYTDDVVETRVWRVSITDAGVFTATSDSLEGEARGQIRGNTLQMKYAMHVATAPDSQTLFDFDDYMILQPDGSLHNMTHVKKWGVRIGIVSTQYYRHDGSKTCAQSSPPVAQN